MADLMSASYDYSALKKKYDDFSVPAAKFTVGGSDLMEMKDEFLADSIEAVLSLDSAGSARIRLTGCYDMEAGSFSSKLKKLAVLGKTVELSLGYGSSCTKIFKGYLAMTSMNLDEEEGISFELTAMDVRRLMMTDNFRQREHSIKNYSDAVSEIMKRYQKLCSLDMDKTAENFKDGLIYQNASDYDFIVRDLIKSGRTEREFFVVADKAYFRKPRSVGTPVVTLGLDQGILSFSRHAVYENQKIIVQGWDPAAGKAVEGTDTAKSADSITDALGAAGERLITDPSCQSSSEAKKRAASIAGGYLVKSQKAEAVCRGLPELVPGRFVRLARVDGNMNKKYYITRVVHRLDGDGFRTELSMEGWE